MRRILLLMIVALVVTTTSLHAQQESLFSQYMFNRLVINPAYAGVKGMGTLTALYRHQWTGYPGQPRTINLSGHTSIMDNRSGIGGYIVNDVAGALSNTALGASYAYRIPVSPKGNLAFGLSLGIIQYSISGEDINTFEANDPVFPNNNQSIIRPDVGFGAFYNTHRFYVGGSVAHLIENDINIVGDRANSRQSRHFFLTSGYDITVGEDLILTPSAFFRWVAGAPAQLDLNANIMLIQKFWAGASYRWNDAVVLLVGLYPHKQVRIGYAYDITASKFGLVNRNGSHEIMLSFDFGDPNKVRVVTPRYF